MRKSIPSSCCCPGDSPGSQRLNKGAATLFLAVLLAFFNVLFSDAALAAAPDGVQTRWEGCKLSSTSTLPNADGDFICADDEYTTGNLGKNWNELDLVPYRLTTSAGNSAPATQTYDLAVVWDYQETGKIGYDVIGVPQINTSKSHASCALTFSPPGGAGSILTPGIGGTDQSIYRLLNITQAKNTTCVIDVYARLALGASQYPGASLHANLTNENFGTSGIGARDVSIPVNEILPQEISKDMTATQDNTHAWNITKGPQPATVNFGDVCAVDQDFEEPVTITVSWTKQAAQPDGSITAITNIYATNPAHRTITVNVTDVIRSGTTELNTENSGDVDVPANTANFLVMTHTFNVPAGSTDLNDVATATYTDKITGIPVPGTTTATATATIQTGTTLNGTAIITDVESIIGLGLSYSTDSFSGAGGSFSGGYIPGTETIGNVTWVSDVQSDSNSVDFFKTLYLEGKQVTSGMLEDTATLVGSNGFTTDVSASVNISSSASVDLTVEKSIPQFYADNLDPGEKLEVTFHVGRAHDASYSQDFVLTFGPGDTLKTTSFSGLVPDTYIVTEVSALFFEAGSAVGVPANLVPTGGTQQSVDINLPTCSNTASFVNAPGTDQPVRAQVQKITDPALVEGDPDYLWYFTLSGPDGQGGVINEPQSAGAGADYVLFDAFLVEGTYTVTETTKPGWDLISAQPNDAITTTVCTFSVNLPQDEGQIFGCTFNNVQRGDVEVIKTSLGEPAAGYDFEIRKDASAGVAGDILATGTSDASGVVNFLCEAGFPAFCVNVGNTAKLVPGNYQLCETGLMPGWANNLATIGTVFVPDAVDNSTQCVNFTLAAGESKSFAVENTPPPGGDARTIGFWRNWSSCDGHGNQDPVLDETITLAGGSILIGDLAVSECLDAVNIISKNSLDGVNRANDAAYGLAAQLLAARLNIVAQAGSCPAADAAMSGGQALLAGIDFVAMGAYLPPTVKTPALKALRNQALNYANTLDSYNNNTLCP